MATKQLNVRVASTVVEDLQYLSYLMRAKSNAEVVTTVVHLVADAVKAAIADDPELYRNGGTVLSREEQAAWQAVVQDLRRRAQPASEEV
jgi:hypothetical protein